MTEEYNYSYMIVGSPSCVNQQGISITTLFYIIQYELNSIDNINRIINTIKEKNNWKDFQILSFQLICKERTNK